MEDDKALSEWLRHFNDKEMSVGWRDNILEGIFREVLEMLLVQILVIVARTFILDIEGLYEKGFDGIVNDVELNGPKINT